MLRIIISFRASSTRRFAYAGGGGRKEQQQSTYLRESFLNPKGWDSINYSIP